jgi:hypothetical protein
MVERFRRLTGDERSAESKRVAKLYKQGKSIREISRASEHSIGRVRSLLVEAGVAFRPRGGRSQSRPGASNSDA